MPADLAALDALWKAATPGPWKVVPQSGHCEDYIVTEHPDFQPVVESGIVSWRNYVGQTSIAHGQEGPHRFSHDAALIAALHNAWPALRDRVRDLEAQVDTLKTEIAELTYAY